MATIFTQSPSESESEIKLEDEIKKDKEKSLQSSWKITYGEKDLEDLLKNEKGSASEKFVIYEKTLSKSKSGDLETKQVSEQQKQQLLKVVLCRTKIAVVNLEDLKNLKGRFPSIPFVSADRKPLTVFMLFGDGRLIDKNPAPEDDIVWKLFDNSFLALRRTTDIPIDHYTHHFSFPPWDIRSEGSRQNAKNMAKILKKSGSLDTDTFLGITTGDMSISLGKILFDIWHKCGWFDREDCEFLKSEIHFRKLSDTEKKVSNDIEEAVKQKNYDDAIRFTDQMHKLSRNEAYQRGTSNVYIDYNKNNKIKFTFIDDCHAAFKLAMHCEKRHLTLYAIEAFKILTRNVVNQSNKVSMIYHSPYTNKARSRIERFEELLNRQKRLIPIPKIDLGHRKLKEKTIKENSASLIKSDGSSICEQQNESKVRRECAGSRFVKDIQNQTKGQKTLIIQGASRRIPSIKSSQSAEDIQAPVIQKLSIKLSLQSLNEENNEDDENYPSPPSSPPSPSLLYSYSALPKSLNSSPSVPSSTPSLVKRSPGIIKRSISTPNVFIKDSPS